MIQFNENSLPASAAHINAELQRAERHLQQLTDLSSMADLQLSLSPYLHGKRLRPVLLLLAASLFKPIGEDCCRAAAALEAVHLASLFHDDVIDETVTRRGVGTLNSSLGNKCSILLGDYVLAQATHVLASLHSDEIITIMTSAAKEMSLGQLLELRHKGDRQTSVSAYMDIIRGKTASLISACCRIGAVLSGASRQQADRLSAYGLNLGLAFQITDDVLDIWGDSQALGKPIFNDIAEHKYTLPLLLARDSASPGERKELLSLLEQPYSDGVRQELMAVLGRQEAKERALETARALASEAAAELDSFAAEPSAQALRDLALWAVVRNA
ncbi:polyprenyl synthetase family protein [bacterium]|nr:polyprenyl synthetase family protein [bacterium]